MSIFGFLKDSGEKLWNSMAGQEAKAANSLKEHLEKFGVGNPNLEIKVDGEKVTISGEVPTQEEKEKVLLTLGNVQGVSEVEDHMTVAEQVAAEAAGTSFEAKEPNFVEVKKGDTLGAIAKRVYGDSSQYNKIFEANKPMLSHPDKIYPGQKLRIPA